MIYDKTIKTKFCGVTKRISFFSILTIKSFEFNKTKQNNSYIERKYISFKVSTIHINRFNIPVKISIINMNHKYDFQVLMRNYWKQGLNAKEAV